MLTLGAGGCHGFPLTWLFKEYQVKTGVANQIWIANVPLDMAFLVRLNYQHQKGFSN